LAKETPPILISRRLTYRENGLLVLFIEKLLLQLIMFCSYLKSFFLLSGGLWIYLLYGFYYLL